MKKQKDLLYLSISCFIVVVAWVCFNIYHIRVTSTISEDLQQQSMPIDPHFDIDLLSRLKSRQQVEPEYTALKGAQTTHSSFMPTPNVTDTPVPSIPLAEQSKQASSSGSHFLNGQ